MVTNRTVDSGSLVLDLELEELHDVKSVYVISEVIYSERVFMEMRLADKKLADEIRNIPVAFSYVKFPVDKDGVLKVSIRFYLTFLNISFSQRSEQFKVKTAIAFQLVDKEDNPLLEVKTHGMKTRSSSNLI